MGLFLICGLVCYDGILETLAVSMLFALGGITHLMGSSDRSCGLLWTSPSGAYSLLFSRQTNRFVTCGLIVGVEGYQKYLCLLVRSRSDARTRSARIREGTPTLNLKHWLAMQIFKSNLVDFVALVSIPQHSRPLRTIPIPEAASLW